VKWHWVNGGALVATLLEVSVGGVTPAAPIAEGGSLRPRFTELEARVGSEPTDARALGELAEAYLERNVPGLAMATLDRAPARVRYEPIVADARARTLAELGDPERALEVQQRVLDECRDVACPRAVVGRGELRARWLREVIRLGPNGDDPDRTRLAYRPCSREVRLDLD
jgi:hypothetical protein